jgi:hypothetical protein
MGTPTISSKSLHGQKFWKTILAEHSWGNCALVIFSLKGIQKINQQTIGGNRNTFGSNILSKNPGAHLSVP